MGSDSSPQIGRVCLAVRPSSSLCPISSESLSGHISVLGHVWHESVSLCHHQET